MTWAAFGVANSAMINSGPFILKGLTLETELHGCCTCPLHMILLSPETVS